MASPKKAFYVLLGLTGVTVAAGVGLFYLFDTQLTTLNSDISQMLAEEKAIDSQKTIYQRTGEQVANLENFKELTDEVLPESKQQANVVAELKKFVIDAGLEFDSVTFSGSESTKGGVEISQTQALAGLVGARILPATVIVREGATYSQVQKMLQIIENNRRKMQVTEISLTPQEESGTFSTITLQIDVYVRSDAAATPANPSATKAETKSEN